MSQCHDNGQQAVVWSILFAASHFLIARYRAGALVVGVGVFSH